MTALLAFLHHLAAFTLVATLAIEFVLIRGELGVRSARRLQLTDMFFGISSGVVLLVGLLRVFYFEKGAAYYFSNHAFLTKLSVFVLVAVLAFVPTVWFLSWRRPLKARQLPVIDGKKQRLVRGLIHAELAGIVIILLCAALMAKGGWV